MSLVRAESLVGAAAAAAADDDDDADGHHPLRRMFSASLFGSLLRRDTSTLKAEACC